MAARAVLCSITVATACLSLTGCATVSTVKRSQGTGTAKTYAAPSDEVVTKTRKALGELGLNLVEVERSQDGNHTSLIATKELSLFSYGERVAIFVTKQDEQRTTVEVVSKRVVTTNVFAKNWTSDIFRTLDRLLLEGAPHAD